MSSSLACKRAFSPLFVTLDATQPIVPKYRIRIAVSIRGDNGSPKDANILGTGRTLISPKRWIYAIVNVINNRPTPASRTMIPEVSDAFIRNQNHNALNE